MSIKYITPLLVGALVMASCNRNGGESQFTTIVSTTEESTESAQSTELVPVLRKAAPAPAPKTQPTTGRTTAKPKATVPVAKGEKIYVETDGAQGRVWGYVTMNGDRGTGTIHDWDENTLSVSVTRHGDELFAIDQNSRQYVFKLKNSK